MTPDAAVHRLLVAVDFDDASVSAVRVAGALAASPQIEVTVVHSATEDAPAYFTAAQLEALEAERAQVRAALAARLRSFAADHLPATTRFVVGDGPPEDVVVRMGSAFDLVVLGTHRRHGAKRWWLGSVARAVVQRSVRPVLVVPAGAVLPEPDRASAILVAGSDTASARRWVDVLRRAFGGEAVRVADICHCAPDRIEQADFVVLSMAADASAPTPFAEVEQVLKECVHPVLFIPSTGGDIERSSS